MRDDSIGGGYIRHTSHDPVTVDRAIVSLECAILNVIADDCATRSTYTGPRYALLTLCI